MADLQRRPGSGPTRRQREQRAYALVLASGALGVVAVVALVLGVVGVVSLAPGLLIAALAALCVYLLRRTLSP